MPDVSKLLSKAEKKYYLQALAFVLNSLTGVVIAIEILSVSILL